MAVNPTNQPVASAARSDTPPLAEGRSGASKSRSPAGRLVSWLRGDRHMVGAYTPIPPSPTADAQSREGEN